VRYGTILLEPVSINWNAISYQGKDEFITQQTEVNIRVTVPSMNSNCPLHCRPQAVPASYYRLLNLTGPPVLQRFSPTTAATSHMSSYYHSSHLPQAQGGTDRLSREGWGKKLGRRQATCIPCNWESIQAVSIEFQLVCSVVVEVDSVLGHIRPHSGWTGRR
jgi:hypothetical protein